VIFVVTMKLVESPVQLVTSRNNLADSTRRAVDGVKEIGLYKL
jgi:hypothetical protein